MDGRLGDPLVERPLPPTPRTSAQGLQSPGPRRGLRPNAPLLPLEKLRHAVTPRSHHVSRGRRRGRRGEGRRMRRRSIAGCTPFGAIVAGCHQVIKALSYKFSSD